MRNHYSIGKKIGEAGCFYIEKGKNKEKKQGEKWLEKKVPLPFFLIFLILFCGVILSIPHSSFLSKNSKLWLASLVSVFDAEFGEKPDFNRDIEPSQIPPIIYGRDWAGEPQFVKLPLSNNVIYELPVSPEKERPKEEKPEPKPKPQKVFSKPKVTERAEIKFNNEEYKNGKYIEVDISGQVMTVYGDGELKGLYRVSTGMKRFATPIGNFKVLRKSVNAWSRAYQCWMPYSLEFTPGLFIHELPLWPGGLREGENHLGIPVSHGCIRLGIGPAKEVFDFADIGTPVIIHQ